MIYCSLMLAQERLQPASVDQERASDDKDIDEDEDCDCYDAKTAKKTL